MTIYAEQITAPFIIVPFAATINFDFDLGMNQACLLTGNATITFANAKEGARYMVAFQQDATGNRTVTWPAAAHFRTGSGDATLSTGANAIDIYEGVVRNGVGYLWALKNFT